MIKGIRLSAGALLIALGTANAAPINYDEGVSGDLPDSGALPVLALGSGVNTVVGTVGFSPAADLDSFAFSVGPGLTLVAATVNLVDAVGNMTNAEWTFRSGSSNHFGGTFVEFLFAPSSGSDSLGAVPLGPGLYNFSWSQLNGDAPFPASSNYTFSLTVEGTPEGQEAPEPASLALFGLALAGLAWSRRRK